MIEHSDPEMEAGVLWYFSLPVRACTHSPVSGTHPHSSLLCFLPIHSNLNNIKTCLGSRLTPLSQRAAHPGGVREPHHGGGDRVGRRGTVGVSWVLWIPQHEGALVSERDEFLWPQRATEINTESFSVIQMGVCCL